MKLHAQLYVNAAFVAGPLHDWSSVKKWMEENNTGHAYAVTNVGEFNLSLRGQTMRKSKVEDQPTVRG